RNQPVERLAGGDARAYVRRGSRIRLDLEEENAFLSIELLEYGLERAARETGPRGDRQPRALEYLCGLAPGGKRPELVCADHEHGVVETLGTKQLDRTRGRGEADIRGREGRGSERQAIFGGGVDHAMPWALAHENEKPLDLEALSRSIGNSDVAEMRRVECAAVEHYSHSSSSSPTSTSSPTRAPAARRIASSSSSAGGVPVTRKPRSVR